MEQKVIFADELDGKYEDGTYGSPLRSYVGKDTVSVTVSDGLIRSINVKPVSGEADQELIDELLINQCRDINYSSQNQDYVNRIYEVLYGHFENNSSEPTIPEISYTKNNDIITVTITGSNVYYSVDGSTPSVLYTKPVVINTSDYNESVRIVNHTDSDSEPEKIVIKDVQDNESINDVYRNKNAVNEDTKLTDDLFDLIDSMYKEGDEQ